MIASHALRRTGCFGLPWREIIPRVTCGVREQTTYSVGQKIGLDFQKTRRVDSKETRSLCLQSDARHFSTKRIRKPLAR